MLAKFIQLKDCQITFKNRISETDKHYTQILAGKFFHQVITCFELESKERLFTQASALSRICQVVADRLVRLKPEAEQFVALQNWISGNDFQIIFQRLELSSLSDYAAQRIIELLQLIPVVKASQVERVYAGRLISQPYVEFLVKRYTITRSHIQDMLMGRTWPERYIAQVSENIKTFQATLQLPISNIIHLLKKHGDNLGQIEVFLQAVQHISEKYPDIKIADIQYFCLENHTPETIMPLVYQKAQLLSIELNIPIGQAFWYVCHGHVK